MEPQVINTEEFEYEDFIHIGPGDRVPITSTQTVKTIPKPKSPSVISDIKKTNLKKVRVKSVKATKYGEGTSTSTFTNSRENSPAKENETPCKSGTLAWGKDIDEIKQLIKSQGAEIMKVQAENNVLLKRLLKRTEPNEEHLRIFPIHNEEDLKKLEDSLGENTDDMIRTIKQIIQPAGIIKNFEKLFGISLILNLNFDGVKGKTGFTKFKKINEVLFRSLAKEGYTKDQYSTEVRAAMKAAKNRHFKNLSHRRKLDKLSEAKDNQPGST